VTIEAPGALQAGEQQRAIEQKSKPAEPAKEKSE
jgi:hypothetical protein